MSTSRSLGVNSLYDMTEWLPFIGALGGGVIGVLLTGFLTTSRRQRSHEAKLRQAAAHDAARDRLGPLAGEIFRWADAVAYDALGPDVDVFDPEGTPRDLGPSAALRSLREIRSTHPTSNVRLAAKALFDEITSCYSQHDHNRGQQFPTGDDRDQVLKNSAMTESLIELIQQPLAEG